MTNWMYVNKYNDHKFIEIRRYPCGHYVVKQSIRANGVINYNGCSVRRSKMGTWRRVTRSTAQAILADYVAV